MELSDLYARQSGVVPIDPQVLLALCVGSLRGHSSHMRGLHARLV